MRFLSWISATTIAPFRSTVLLTYTVLLTSPASDLSMHHHSFSAYIDAFVDADCCRRGSDSMTWPAFKKTVSGLWSEYQ